MNGKTNKNNEEIKRIIQDGDSRQLVETAKSIAKSLVNGKISTSQIRNIYGTSKKIELALNEDNVESSYNKLILLKPKMAYAFGRLRSDREKKSFEEFKEQLSLAIDRVDGNFNRMKNFFNFFEAILAYHKALGGK